MPMQPAYLFSCSLAASNNTLQDLVISTLTCLLSLLASKCFFLVMIQKKYFASYCFYVFFFESLFLSSSTLSSIMLVQIQCVLVLGLGCCWALTLVNDLVALKGRALGKKVQGQGYILKLFKMPRKVIQSLIRVKK